MQYPYRLTGGADDRRGAKASECFYTKTYREEPMLHGLGYAKIIKQKTTRCVPSEDNPDTYV